MKKLVLASLLALVVFLSLTSNVVNDTLVERNNQISEICDSL